MTIAILILLSTSLSNPRADPVCDSVPAYHLLDFWVGEWEVKEKDVVVGHNRIEKIAGGCALIEHWQDVSGEEGKSLFYYLRGRKDWKQVWVQPGGVKEKRLIARYPDGAVRFQGELPRADGSLVLDRTTLSPLSDGRVRQIIEQSMDGGRTWSVGFDAYYSRGRAAVLTADDVVAIRALDSTFVRGWLLDDTSAVLGVFRADAVLLPPGSQVISGLPAIRDYWWPTDGSHTRITTFDRRIVEIEGTRSLAYIRGTAVLGWNYAKGGAAATQTSRSADLILVAPDSTGHWRVIRQMWSTLP